MTLAEIEKRVRHLAQISAVLSHARKLRAFFDALDADGWAIEYARTYLGIVSQLPITQQTWAEALGLPDSRAYRTIVSINSPLRAHLLVVACAVTRFESATAVSHWVGTVEMARWRAALREDISDRASRRGRPLDTIYTADAKGAALETQRLALGLTIKRWAQRLGTSENTYRTHLTDAAVPVGWVEAASRVAIERKAAIEIPAARPASADQLLSDTWRAYQAHGSLVTTQPDALPEVREELEIDLSYKPDEEAPL